jgi:hypothetical protein
MILNFLSSKPWIRIRIRIHIETVLLHNGGFFKTCTMKRCLHRKVDFITNASNNAHVSQLLHHKAGLLQNDGIIIYLLIKTNS